MFLSSFLKVLPEKHIGRMVIACCVIDSLRRHLVELHLLDARRLVLARRDHAVLDRVVDLVVGDHGRRHADAAKVFDQIGAPCTRTLRPFISCRLCTGLLTKMLRVPPPA